jgi:hypothetical protein
VLRYAYAVLGLDVGPFVQQECHGVRLTLATGVHQGRPTILQREGGHVWSYIGRIIKRGIRRGDAVTEMDIEVIKHESLTLTCLASTGTPASNSRSTSAVRPSCAALTN